MQVLFLVLNKIDCLEGILENFAREGIKGATVIESTGMARILNDVGNDVPIFGSIRMIMNEKYPFNKTIFVVIEDHQLDTAVSCIKKETGELSKPDVGIIFTIPVGYVEGINVGRKPE